VYVVTVNVHLANTATQLCLKVQHTLVHQKY